MDIDLFKNIGFFVAALILSGFFIRKYRHFFEWKKDDDWQTHFQRAAEEHKRDADARKKMLESLGALNLINIAGIFLICYAGKTPDLMYALIIYVTIGLFVSRRTVHNKKTDGYERLSFGDKFWFRLFFAWTWPLKFLIK